MKYNDTKHKLKRGAFTLVELMLLLVVLSLIFASSAAVITRKHRLKPRKSVHGIYVCYRDNASGLLRETSYSGKTKLVSREQTEGDDSFECTFEAPKTAPYLYVQLIGGGGAGGNANQPTSGFYGGEYSGLTAPANGFGEGKENYSTPLSFIKEMMESSEDDRLAEEQRGTGLTKDYIHTFKKDEKTFSVRALKDFFTKHELKFIVFDELGHGGNGVDVQHSYLFEDTDIADKRASENEPVRWYKSSCMGTHTSYVPEKCLYIQLLYGADLPISSTTTSLLKYVRPESASYGIGEYEAGTRSYCQYRPPLSENCPWLRTLMVPRRNNEDSGEPYITCKGQKGGTSGIVSSLLKPFDFGYTFKLGNRGGINGKSKITSCEVDIEVMDGDRVSVDYTNAKAGTLLKKEDACDETGANCKDIHGNAISTTNEHLSFTDDNYLRSWVYSLDLATAEKPSGDYYNSYYFKTFPALSYKFGLKLAAGHVLNCANADTYKSDGKIIGNNGGDSSALPYFGSTIEEGSTTTKSGIRLCVNGSCTTYGRVNGKITYETSMISQDSKGISKGGKGAIMKKNAIDEYFLKNDTAIANGEVCEPLGSEYAEGPNPTWVTAPAGYQDLCSYRIAFRYKSLSGDGAHMLKLGDGRYGCPDGYGDIGLLINHASGNMKLYYGEKGRAGIHRPFFTRSFGSSKLLINPGRGGVAFKSTNYRTARGADGSSAPAVEDENKNTATANYYGRNGSDTVFGTDCVKKSSGGTGNGDDYDCAISISAPGGGGGRTHIEDLQEIKGFSNEDIYHFAKDTTLSPELQALLVRYSSNYTPDDLINSPHIGELSGFQEISYLSDLSIMENGDFLANLGRGGDGGYIKHNCFLRPQYFVYHGNGIGTLYGDKYRYDPGSNSPIAFGNVDKIINDGYDEWEGYTSLSQGVINKVCGLSESTSESTQVGKFIEYEPTDGYPGAVVIMW